MTVSYTHLDVYKRQVNDRYWVERVNNKYDGTGEDTARMRENFTNIAVE